MAKIVFAQVAAKIQPADISDNEYKAFERKLEKIEIMKKRGRPKEPPKLPTPEQEVWLKAHYNMYTRKKLAEKLEVNIKKLRAWLKYLGIKKQRGPITIQVPLPPPVQPKPEKEIIRLKPDVKPQRPRADHTNMTQEQRIDYWINYPI